MGKKCYTCKKKYRKMASVEKKSVKGLNTKFLKSNFTLGEMLKRVGVKIDHREDWDSLICCRKCWSVLKQWNTLNKKADDLSERWLKQTGEKLPVFARAERKTGAFKTQASKYIQCSEYGKAISVIRRSSEAARTAWLRGITRVVTKEMIGLERDRYLFEGLMDGGGGAKGFDWEGALAEVERKTPTLYYVLVAALSRKGDLYYGNSRKQALAAPRLGTMLQIALYHRRPMIHRLSPAFVATSLWGVGSRNKIACLKSVRTLGAGRRLKVARRKAPKLAKPREGRLPVPYHEELAKRPETGWREENDCTTTGAHSRARRNPESGHSGLHTDYEEIRKACDQVQNQLEEASEEPQEHNLTRVSQDHSSDILLLKPESELTTTPEVAMEINISQAGSGEYIETVLMDGEEGEEEEEEEVHRPKRKRNVVTQQSFEVTLHSYPIPDEMEGE